MQIQPRLPSSTTLPASPSPAGAAPPAPETLADPVDQRVPSTTPPPEAPKVHAWPELAKLGLLGATSTVSGPIGAVLTDSARRGLLETLKRLDAAGVKLDRARPVYLPYAMDKHVPLTPEQALERLEGQKGEFQRLRVQAPGQAEPTELRSLKDLRALDAFVGAGLEVLDPQGVEVASALTDLAEAGWKFAPGRYSYRSADPPMTAADAFRALEDGQGVLVTLQPGKSYELRNPEQVRALDFFQGSGKDRGLSDPVLARRLKEAEARGLSLHLEGYEAPAWSVYGAEPSKPAGVALPGRRYSLPLDPQALADPDRLKARLEEFDQPWARSVQPALKAAGGDSGANEAAALLFADDPLPLEARAAVLGELLRGCAKHEQAYHSIPRAINLYREVREGATSAFDLARKANLVLPTLNRSGAEAASELLKSTVADLQARGAGREADEEVKDLFFRFLQATGSTQAASEAADLVRIPVGTETTDERAELFLALAARESDSTLPNSALHYRAVLVHRHPEEGVVPTGKRFLQLLEGLAIGRHQDRAPEVFAHIQADLRAGRIDAAGADQRVGRFLSHLALSNDVDRALEALAGGDGTPGEIQTGDDFVVIGGIRIKRN